MNENTPLTFCREELVQSLAADIRFFEDCAGIVAGFLQRLRRRMGLRRPLVPPAAFLYELAAIIRIAHWQRSPALAELGADFAPAGRLLADLLRRAEDDPQSFCGEPKVDPESLMARVHRVWRRRCSWHAMSELGCDLALSWPAVDRLAEAIASLASRHQHFLETGNVHPAEK